MININDIKNGMTVEYENNIYVINEFQHVKPGKGPAFVKTKLKNLRTGANIEITFNTNIKLKRAIIEKQKVQYLYDSGDSCVFMNNDTYEQIEISKDKISDEIQLLTENLEVQLTFYENELLGLELPDKIEMKVIFSDPGVKGNTTSTATKEAKLETGLLIKVPMFINEGDIIIVSTKDKKYVSRK
ncbi:MAG: elongation factor P [Bacilli bacterium]|nr:elongation factor P [Bacilli bacterium]